MHAAASSRASSSSPAASHSASAQHTSSAALDASPAPGGTAESITPSIPTGSRPSFASSRVTPAM